jgi:hypothetical protein
LVFTPIADFQCILNRRREAQDQREKEKSVKGGLSTLLFLGISCALNQTALSTPKPVRVRAEGQGWTNSEGVMSLILLDLGGGERVKDLNRLEWDEGLCRVLTKIWKHGLKRKERRAMDRRWRK